MNQSDFLERLTQRLKRIGIPYMVTGSLSSTHYGEPRTTQDIDIVIDPSSNQLETFFVEFDENQYYLNTKTARQALRDRSLFNIIDYSTGWKADLIIRKDRPFSSVEFQRRIETKLLGIDVFLASAEDILLSKLEWSKKSGSQRQFSDAKSILVVTKDLDIPYLQRWAKELGVGDLLNQLLANQTRNE